VDVSADAPYLDCAYKLQEYAGRPRRKRSEDKATWPGRKQVFRRFRADGTIAGDVLTLEGDRQAGTALLVPFLRGGKRLAAPDPLARLREQTAVELGRLPTGLRSLETVTPPPVEVSTALRELAAAVDAHTG
jgi:nicotinate phosphoribosyltransferase